MDWNETLRSASFHVNCIPGLNEAAVKVQRVFRIEVFPCGKYLVVGLLRASERSIVPLTPA